MVSNEMRSIIGQCCPEYESRSFLNTLSMLSLAESCDNCSNFVKGQCIKELLEAMSEKIQRN